MTIGISGRLAYRIQLANDFALEPQYLYYLGFDNEFKNIIGDIKSSRHFVGIGILKTINKK